MPRVHPKNIKPDDEILVGTRGRTYIVRGNRRYYITDKTYEYGRSYKPRPGAYNRFIQSQLNGITSQPEVVNSKRSSGDHRDGKGVRTQERQKYGDWSSTTSVSDYQQALESLRDGEHVRRDPNNQRNLTTDPEA